jgi:hypothetical protein
MANTKISALTSATTPLAGTEVLPIVQSSATVKVATNDLTVRNVRANATTGILQVTGPAAASTRVMTVPDANFTAARTDAAQSFTGDQTLSTGNLIQGTAAKGFNFTANTPAAGMTAQLLNWYEEGTWTPTLTGSSSNPTVTYDASRYGRYVRIGSLVMIECELGWNAISGGTGTPQISGIPFSHISTPGFVAAPIGLFDGWNGGAGYTNISVQLASSGSNMALVKAGSGVAGAGTAFSEFSAAGYFRLSMCYRT